MKRTERVRFQLPLWIALASLLLLACLLAPLLVGDPVAQDFTRLLHPPDRQALLGTDQLGRDVLARLLYAGRTSLSLSALVLAGNSVIGILIGLAAGMAGGRTEHFLMRLTDLTLTFPGFLLAGTLSGVFGPGPQVLVPALILSQWTAFARLSRALTLRLRHTEMLVAARALGGTPGHILRRHIWSNVRRPLAVQISLEAGQALLSVSSLSFLGFGVQPPTPEWGVMLTEARAVIWTAPHLLIAPGAAVLLIVVGLHQLAGWLEESR